MQAIRGVEAGVKNVVLSYPSSARHRRGILYGPASVGVPTVESKETKREKAEMKITHTHSNTRKRNVTCVIAKQER